MLGKRKRIVLQKVDQEVGAGIKMAKEIEIVKVPAEVNPGAEAEVPVLRKIIIIVMKSKEVQVEVVQEVWKLRVE